MKAVGPHSASQNLCYVGHYQSQCVAYFCFLIRVCLNDRVRLIRLTDASYVMANKETGVNVRGRASSLNKSPFESEWQVISWA